MCFQTWSAFLALTHLQSYWLAITTMGRELARSAGGLPADIYERHIDVRGTFLSSVGSSSVPVFVW